MGMGLCRDGTGTESMEGGKCGRLGDASTVSIDALMVHCIPLNLTDTLNDTLRTH